MDFIQSEFAAVENFYPCFVQGCLTGEVFGDADFECLCHWFGSLLVYDVTECYHRCDDDSEGENARDDDCKVYDFLLRCLRLHTKILQPSVIECQYGICIFN